MNDHRYVRHSKRPEHGLTYKWLGGGGGKEITDDFPSVIEYKTDIDWPDPLNGYIVRVK